MHPQLNVAFGAARTAGKVIMQWYDRRDRLTIEAKQPHDFVSEVDREVERILIDSLLRAYPDHAVLGEEGGRVGSKEPGAPCWIIDPLDGTSNYLQGIPHFAISIALKEAGKITVALVYDPFREELFTAVSGGGARLNDQRIRVGQKKLLNEAVIVTGIPVRYPERMSAHLKTFETVAKNCSSIRSMGAASLDLAYVAAGRFDAYWEEGLQPWDTAAGTLLVLEAGGFISDYKGEKNYLDQGNIIAGSPKVFKELQEIVQAHQ